MFARIIAKVEKEKTAAGSSFETPLPRSRTRTSTTCSANNPEGRDVLHQLRLARDQLQDRLLRPRPVREDDQPAVHLREDQARREGQADLAGHRDRPHAVLRLPAAGPGHDPRASRRASTSTRCPGQVFYDASRKLILKGVDGVVFVADSPGRAAWRPTSSAIDNLEENLRAGYGILTSIPYVLQYNKRDLPNVVAVEELRRLLNPQGQPVPDFEAVASTGIGVFETLKGVAKLVLSELTEDGVVLCGPDEARPAALGPYRRFAASPPRPPSAAALTPCGAAS